VQPADKLVMMANQIARNLATLSRDDAAAKTADHIRRYWDPRMRAAISRYVAEGGTLDPIAQAAVLALAPPGGHP
jgi:formate dehydrogenase subunit delta